MWNTFTGEEIFTLEGHKNVVRGWSGLRWEKGRSEARDALDAGSCAQLWTGWPGDGDCGAAVKQHHARPDKCREPLGSNGCSL